MKKTYKIEVDCANCAQKMEDAANKIAGVKSAAVNFSKGDSVRHTAFGKGMVLNIQPMGGDALIEIAFDNVGTKRLMYNSAKQYLEKA